MLRSMLWTVAIGRNVSDVNRSRRNPPGNRFCSTRWTAIIVFCSVLGDRKLCGGNGNGSGTHSSRRFLGATFLEILTTSWRTGLAVPKGRWPSSSARFYGTSVPKHEHVLPRGPLPGRNVEGREETVANVLRDVFSEPSQGWDNRLDKVTEKRCPDFHRKKTWQGLWLDDSVTSPWVETELGEGARASSQSNIFSWNKRVERCVKAGHYEKAIGLFQQMQREGMDPDTFTFVQVLNACSKLRVLEHGIHFHQQIIRAGHESNAYVGNCLVDMYAKCGSINAARQVFNEMPTRDVVAWSTMLGGYVKCGKWLEALKLSRQMQQEGVDPNPVTFLGLLNACASLQALEEGRRVHEQIIQKGYESHAFLGSSLVHMYAKCGSIEDARRVFNEMPRKDVVAWGAMLVGLAKCGEGQEALDLFWQMQLEGVDPDRVIFLGVLNACASLGSLEEGRRVHEQITKRGYESDAYVGNCLVDMYAKCRSIYHARKVFDELPRRDVVSWGAMLMGYVKCGEGQEALKLYEYMQLEQVHPNSVAFVGVLSACASLRAVDEGRSVHEQIIERGYDSDVYVGNSLVDMYAKCGSIENARQVFDKMPTRDLVAWNALVGGYVNCGQGQEALKLWQQMQQERMDPNPVTFVGLLNACASLGVLEEGRHLHEEIIKRGYELDDYVSKCLVAMYSKCGSIEDAQRVFNKKPTTDLVTWNCMLAGYGTNGYAREALVHFNQMLEVVTVDGVTFISLLSACSHGGLVDEGLYCFQSMSAVFNISPKVEHYGCVVDLLGRTGRLHEAEDLIKTIPCDPGASVWTSLLSACRIHGNMDMGDCVAKPVLELEPENAVGYVLISNMYAAVGNPDNNMKS